MKIILIAFLVIQALSLLMVVLTAKCRSGASMDKESTWLPFQEIYKAFLLVELAVLAVSLSQSQMACIALCVIPFLVDLMALIWAIKDGFSYTITNPWDGMLDDVIRLKEHRFYPVNGFSPKFFVFGLQDNAFRVFADVVMVAAIIKTLHFL